MSVTINERYRNCPDLVTALKADGSSKELTDRIIECFSAYMSKLALFWCKEETLAEDAFQESVVIAMKAIESFRGESSLETWLSKLVRTACSRMRRGRKNSPAYNLPMSEVSERADPDSDGELEVKVQLNERLEILGRSMMELDPINRELFLLHEGQDESIKDLAGKFDLTEEAVKSRLKRTREGLRDRLLKIAQGEEAV
jgi:RNA polymerase sigma-70 factor (ECF subfamily)